MQRHLLLGMQLRPQTIKALMQRSFTFRPLLATSWQDAVNNSAYHQAINQSCSGMDQQPATQQVKEKRVARAHAHEARAERVIEFYAAAGKM